MHAAPAEFKPPLGSVGDWKLRGKRFGQAEIEGPACRVDFLQNNRRVIKRAAHQRIEAFIDALLGRENQPKRLRLRKGAPVQVPFLRAQGEVEGCARDLSALDPFGVDAQAPPLVRACDRGRCKSFGMRDRPNEAFRPLRGAIGANAHLALVRGLQRPDRLDRAPAAGGKFDLSFENRGAGFPGR